jgi:hypothetical protein
VDIQPGVSQTYEGDQPSLPAGGKAITYGHELWLQGECEPFPMMSSPGDLEEQQVIQKLPLRLQRGRQDAVSPAGVSNSAGWLRIKRWGLQPEPSDCGIHGDFWPDRPRSLSRVSSLAPKIEGSSDLGVSKAADDPGISGATADTSSTGRSGVG